ncbi:hypothetical protein BDV25DRAFT_165212 [Aspergillus avenaceus]|uniref:Uncharacterized protein n=1 Tax=Aspergillus avenaceus TaxID=36643 RepID=A0A5N6TFN9_ASPAV|nr:hypothetical protein BDV25DRAFT_165212 [Aspergillus avenaceus]
MDKQSTNGNSSSQQDPTHLDLAKYQAEWARIHENTVRQIAEFKAKSANSSQSGSQRSSSGSSSS